jgi:hypothetical protein
MEAHALFRLKSIRCIARGTGVKPWKIIVNHVARFTVNANHSIV